MAKAKPEPPKDGALQSADTETEELHKLDAVHHQVPHIQHDWRIIRNTLSQLRLWVEPAVTNQANTASPHIHQEAWLLHPAAILLGLAAGWQWAGMRMMLGAILDPSSATVTMLGAIALLMAAVGPRIPGHVVLSLVRLFGRQWRSRQGSDRDASKTFWMLQAIRNRDESLLWLSLAVLCSTAGAVTLLTLFLGAFATQLYHYLLERFFWTSLTLTVLEWTGATLWLGGAWLMLGLAVSALASVAAAHTQSRRSPPGIAAGLLLGLAIAWLLHDLWADRGMSASQILMLAALPMFALAVIAATLSQRTEQQQTTEAASEADMPEISGQAEGWIWLALVVWGIGSVLAISGWLICRWVVAPHGGWTWDGPSGYLLVLGVGVALASFHARHKKQSVSGCGMALWAAGVAVGMAAMLVALRPVGSVSGFIQLTVLALPVGYALHYAERAWLARAGSETLGFAQMMTALLGGCAISLIADRWWLQSSLGPTGTMAAGALVMLSYGGLVQIYEDGNPVHIQRLRIGLVFASLAAAIVLFPAGVTYWDSTAHTATSTASVRTVPFESADLMRTRRICLIGSLSQTTIPALNDYKGEVDLLPLSSNHNTALTPIIPSAQTHTLTNDGLRSFRLQQRRYDLIYQHGPENCNLQRFAAYSIEWLMLLAQQTTAAGKVILDVPLTGMTPETMAVIAATFKEAMGPNSQWRLFDTTDHPTLRLSGTPHTMLPSHDHLTHGWSHIDSLAESQGMITGCHSIHRDRLTRTIQQKPYQSPALLIEWLKSHSRSER